MRQGQRHDHPPAEVPHGQQPRGEGEDDADADREHDLDLVGQAAAERPITRGEAEDDDREEVEHPLDEDRPERPRQRHRAVDLEQIRPVQVAELGRDQAVDQPADEDDLAGVADPEAEAGASDQQRPAEPAEREPDVEHRERHEQQQRVRAEDQARQLLQAEPGEGPGEEDQQDEREDERDDRAPLAQPAAQRQLVGGDPVGSPILAGPPLDASPSIRFKRDGLLVATVAAASSLLTGPPLVIRRTRRLSRPVQAAHRSTGTDRSRAGRTLPLPRARWTTFASGVSSRT